MAHFFSSFFFLHLTSLAIVFHRLSEPADCSFIVVWVELLAICQHFFKQWPGSVKEVGGGIKKRRRNEWPSYK